MVNGKLKTANGQRGQALILVLIALALGSLLITPTVNYVSAGLVETRVSEDMFLNQYAADAAAEYSLWQLKYNVDNIVNQLGTENPSSTTSVTINGMEIPITTEISYSPESDEGAFTVPGSLSGIHIAAALDIRPTCWSGAGQKSFLTHVVYIYNYGTSAVHPKGLFQRLDPELKYVQGSYDGPDANLTKTLVGDHWELNYEFTNPLPTLGEQDIMTITFATWAKKDMGEYTFSGDGWVSYAAFQAEEVECYSGESGVASFGLYDITATAGSYTILINVGITEEGEIVVRSWQVQ